MRAAVNAESASPASTGAPTASTSALVRNGLVHWIRSTTTGVGPGASRACSTADSDVAVSPLRSPGRATISAPAARATSAISGSSVETITVAPDGGAGRADRARDQRHATDRSQVLARHAFGPTAGGDDGDHGRRRRS